MNRILEEDFNNILDVDAHALKGKKILITGSTGFIGGYLKKFLEWLNTKNWGMALYLWTRDTPLDTVVDEMDYIFHCASPATPKQNTESYEGALYTNVLMTEALAKIAKRTGAKMLFLSAGEIYGKAGAETIYEDSYHGFDPLELRSCYPETKRLGENICSFFAKDKASIYIARLFHTYGPGIKRSDPRIFSVLLDSILDKKPIMLQSNGGAIRSFCYISDVIRAFFTILERGETGFSYNIAGASTSVEELATKLGIKYALDVFFKKKADTSGFMCYPTRMCDFGWKPSINILNGFDRTIEYMKEEGL